MLQIMKYTWLLLFIFIIPAQAQIYRWVDDNGNVVYSDEPHPQAETVDLPPSTTYTPVDAEAETDDILKLTPPEADEAKAQQQSEVPNYQLRIIAPADDESIWVNNGNVTVSMIVEPELNSERGDLVQLQLDGNNVGEPQAATSFQLSNLSRGSHNVTAMVTDNSGVTLASSATVTFHLHRASKLNKPAQNSNNNSN